MPTKSGLNETSRRQKGEGTLEELPDGTFRCYTRMAGKKVSARGRDKIEASYNLQKKLRESTPDALSARSLKILANSWLTEQKDLSPTTKETYGYWISKSIDQDPIGNIKLKDIKDRDLKAWVARLPKANSTRRNRCRWLNQILSSYDSPARAPVPSKKDHDRRPLSPAERDSLLEKLKKAHPQIVLAAMLCWYCGLRRSEACGLKHEDRDGDGFRVRRVAIITVGKIHIRHKGKSSRALRWVALPEPLLPLIGNGKTGYVLGEGKNPMNPKSLSWHMAQLIEGTEAAKVPHVGAHALRRTYGQTLLEAGADIVTAAQLMGHDVMMLAKEYARSREDLMTDAVKRAFPGLTPIDVHTNEAK